jgi:hypothetical protein
MQPIWSRAIQYPGCRPTRVPRNAAYRKCRRYGSCWPRNTSLYCPSSKRNRPPGTVSCDTPDSDRATSQHSMTTVPAQVREPGITRIPGLCRRHQVRRTRCQNSAKWISACILIRRTDAHTCPLQRRHPRRALNARARAGHAFVLPRRACRALAVVRSRVPGVAGAVAQRPAPRRCPRVQWTQFAARTPFRRPLSDRSKCGSILAKASVLRVNLNLDGAPIASNSHTHPSHSQSSRLLTSALSLGVPVPRPTQCMGVV